jgi:heptosyltransferase-1
LFVLYHCGYRYFDNEVNINMSIKNILVVKLSAIGDVIHALPVSYALKETFPDAKVTWVVEPPAYDLLTNNPYIDHIIVFEKKKFKSINGFFENFPAFSAELKKIKYDVVLDLQGLGKSAVIAWMSGAPLKLGCSNMRELSNWVSKPVCGSNQNGHIVERYLDVVRALGCKVEKVVFPVEITEKEADIATKLMRQAGMNSNNPYVVLAVGANWANKRWPTKFYAALVDALYAKEIIPVVIGGGVIDSRLVAEINEKAEIPAVDLVGKTTLKQLAYMIKNAKAVVGGDTGPMHLAAGLGKPVVMLMGPTDTNRNGPYGQAQNAIEITRTCKHCWKRKCRFNIDCLEEITVGQVMDQLQTMME